MNKIEVFILNEASVDPAGMMMFLAKLTQRGHKITDGKSLLDMYHNTVDTAGRSKEISTGIIKLPHGSIKRHTPITIAIVGASRRFLSQARTHHVGIDFVSASLQYSDYSGGVDFVVPYEIIEKGKEFTDTYLSMCKDCLDNYYYLVNGSFGYDISNDTAGYVMPQGMRNILIATANHEAWFNFIKLRTCNRNTNETQYIAALIWEALYCDSYSGDVMFKYAGPQCLHGKCLEGKMCCGKPYKGCEVEKGEIYCSPESFIQHNWPLLEVID